jgi:hypothetical protein
VPGGGHLFTGSRAPGKGCWTAECRECALLGVGATPEGGRSYRVADGLQAVENRAVGTLNGGLCAPVSPSVGPREANFFPYLSIQLPAVGDHLLGLGITRFRLAWKVRALTRLSPWGGSRARRFPAGRLRPRVIGRGAFAWRDSWSPWCDIRAPSWHCAGLAYDCHRCGRRSKGRCADRRSF